MFFSHTSQGHNALPWPRLEPGLSDSEPSALATGQLDKGVVLACLRYSWPRMLKVAPCAVVQLYGCTTKFFRLDGLLLFCIIIGLCSTSSAIIINPLSAYMTYWVRHDLFSLRCLYDVLSKSKLQEIFSKAWHPGCNFHCHPLGTLDSEKVFRGTGNELWFPRVSASKFFTFLCDFFPPSWLQYCSKEAWLFIRGKRGIFVFLLQTTLADGSI